MDKATVTEVVIGNLKIQGMADSKDTYYVAISEIVRLGWDKIVPFFIDIEVIQTLLVDEIPVPCVEIMFFQDALIMHELGSTISSNLIDGLLALEIWESFKRAFKPYVHPETQRRVTKIEYQKYFEEKKDFLMSIINRFKDKKIQQESSKTDSGYVYFLLNPSTQLVKIGMSKYVEKRIATLQTASGQPLRLICKIRANNMKEKERYYHDKFKWNRVSGEWFIYSDEIKAELGTLFRVIE